MFPRTPVVALVILLGVFAPPWAGVAQPFLGKPPTAPKDISGLPRRSPARQSVTGGFSVNTDSREEVRSFYNAVYPSSDGVPMDTTADVASCTHGTNSTAFKEAVLRRINWFRAMAGVPASVTLDTAANTNDQAAAVMMSANTNLNHHPPATWLCYTTNGANAASNSNLALGNAGPDAISAYIWDFGANNYEVGHRRWILYPQTQVMGTGDVPQTSTYSAANATWVIDANVYGPRPATRQPYVAWPPEGYVPFQVVYPQWSFALSNADFSAATVSMLSNGVSVAVALQPYVTGYGENTLVWVPMGLDATSTSTEFPFDGTDTVYSVTVTNIKVGASTIGYSYSVTLFDPAVPGDDYYPPIISGPDQPAVGQSNAYTFTAVTNATGYQWRAVVRAPYSFFDGAENGLGNFVVNTSAGYAVQDSSVVASGSYSFHLAQPNPPTDQMLTLNQAFVPETSTTLTFESRLGYAGSGQTARVQVSGDGGVTWTDLYAQTGTGGSGEANFTSRSLPLASFAGTALRLRFNYTIGNGTYFPQTDPGVGWYLDNISVTNAELWTTIVSNSVATTNFIFSPLQIGTYSLQAQALIFTQFPVGWGPAKTVTAIVGPPVIVMNQPGVVNGQVQLDFNLASGVATTFRLLQTDQLGTPWTTNASATLTTNIPGSSYRFTTPVGPATRFYRVQTP